MLAGGRPREARLHREWSFRARTRPAGVIKLNEYNIGNTRARYNRSRRGCVEVREHLALVGTYSELCHASFDN